MNTAVLGPLGIKAFEARGINVETAVKFGIYTARTTGDISPGKPILADPNGNIVVFPFVEHGNVVAEKYRAPNKVFWQRKGGKRTFWNSDVLDDPALEAGTAALVITEGEIDALTAIDCGFPFTVSVPDGAPAVRDGESPSDLKPTDPETEKTGKFEFVWNNRERLKKIKRFILAVDNDDPGKRLEAELLRRLSAARCMFVTYPEGCKDLSDVRQKYGAEAVAKCLNGAMPYPVRGLYRLDDYPELPQPETFSTGFSDLDSHLRFWLGELVVVTGIPGSGKSSWIINVCTRMATLYGWTVAMASFEIPTVPTLRDKIRMAKTGLPPEGWSNISKCDAWIRQHFVFIDDDPTGDDDEEMTLEWVLDRAADAVLRDGIRMLVVDPWNEIEHSRPRGESETDYYNRAVRACRRFAARYQVLVIILAHPTKDVGKDGSARVPTPYDIAGSAAWFNKPDHCITVDVPDAHNNETVIWVKKVRFNWSGKRGDVTLRYLPLIESYDTLHGMTPVWKLPKDDPRGKGNEKSKSEKLL
jgi:twinkle protein